MKKDTCKQHEIVRKYNDYVGSLEIEMELEECCYDDYVLRIWIDGCLKKDLSFGSASQAKNFGRWFIAWAEQLGKHLKELL